MTALNFPRRLPLSPAPFRDPRHSSSTSEIESRTETTSDSAPFGAPTLKKARELNSKGRQTSWKNDVVTEDTFHVHSNEARRVHRESCSHYSEIHSIPSVLGYTPGSES